MGEEPFVQRPTTLQQRCQFERHRLRCGPIWREARGAVDVVIPVRRPYAVLRLWALLPRQHAWVEIDPYPIAKGGDHAGGILEQEPRIHDDRPFPTLEHFVQQLDLKRKARPADLHVWHLFGQRRQHFPRIASEKDIRQPTEKAPVETREVVGHVLYEEDRPIDGTEKRILDHKLRVVLLIGEYVLDRRVSGPTRQQVVGVIAARRLPGYRTAAGKRTSTPWTHCVAPTTRRSG